MLGSDGFRGEAASRIRNHRIFRRCVQPFTGIRPRLDDSVHRLIFRKARSGQLQQTIRAQRPSSVSARRHHQDCRNRQLGVAAPPANQVVALAAGFEPELGNRRWIIDQLDSYKILVRFHKVPRKLANLTLVLV
jgi:hypothetical protein